MRRLRNGDLWFSYVYLLECGGLYKIGFSRAPRVRAKRLQTGSPEKVWVVHLIRTAHFRHVEKLLHEHFALKRTRGEWFRLDDADVDYIKSLDHYGYPPSDSRFCAAFRDHPDKPPEVWDELRAVERSERFRETFQRKTETAGV